MFGRKKIVDINKVKSFHDALGVIKTYIKLFEWEKARTALEDLKEKETLSFHELEDSLKDNPGVVLKQKKIFQKHLEIINKLKRTYDIEKLKYERSIETKRFKVRFDKIKKEIKKLSDQDNNSDALNILNHFLEENKSRSEVTDYYQKEKKRILNNIKKQQKKDKSKIKQNAELEAMKLAEITLKTKVQTQKRLEQEKLDKKNNNFIHRLMAKVSQYKEIQARIEKKKMLDQIKIFLEEWDKAKEEIAEKKLENIHKGLIKELEKSNMVGFDLYGKILGSDKISGDSFGFNETKNKYNLYIGDATGHGVRAGLIVSILSKSFQENAGKEDLVHLTQIVNNTLKDSLQSRNFVTGLFFELDKKFRNVLKVSGLGHEPLLIFHKKNKDVERSIVGGLAGGIRHIKNIEDIKPKSYDFNNGDIMLTYTDGVLEAKNPDGEIYGIERLEKIFRNSAQVHTDIKKIYQDIIEDLKYFRGGSNFKDDTSILILRRNSLKDLVNIESEEIQELREKEGLTQRDLKKLNGKSKEEVLETLEEIKKEKQTKNIVEILKAIYLSGETLKLKQEATRYIKQGYIDKQINYYLRKAIENEELYRVKQKNTKMENKYNVLVELLKKKDFNTVIQECNEIISKDWNI